MMFVFSYLIFLFRLAIRFAIDDPESDRQGRGADSQILKSLNYPELTERLGNRKSYQYPHFQAQFFIFKTFSPLYSPYHSFSWNS